MELGNLRAGMLVLAVWVDKHESYSPELWYYCSGELTPAGLYNLRTALAWLASRHLLGRYYGLTPDLIVVKELGGPGAAGGSSAAAPVDLRQTLPRTAQTARSLPTSWRRATRWSPSSSSVAAVPGLCSAATSGPRPLRGPCTSHRQFGWMAT